MGNYKKAIQWYEQGLKIFEGLNNEIEIAKARLNLAIAHQRLSEHREALENGEKALYIFEKLKDANGISRVYNILGITLMAQKNYREAKRYFLMYNAYARQINATAEIANSYNSLGSVYTNLKLSDSSGYFFNKAAEINRATNNNIGLAHNYQNIGVLYHENLNNDVKALTYYKKAESLYRELKHLSFLSQTLVDIGQAYKSLRDTTNARVYLNKALIMANQAGGQYWSQEVSKALLKMVNEPESEDNGNLTPRELEVLKLIADQLSTRKIAGRLFLSERTVETHRKNLMRKTKSANTAGLIKYAFTRHLLN